MTETETISMIDHLDLVERVVGGVHVKYRGWVEWDDLVSEAAVWWYGRGQKHLAEYLEDQPHQTRLRRSIWRHLSVYAEREKAARSGYRPEDQYRYSAGEIVTLLPLALDPAGLPQPGHNERGPKPTGNQAEGGNLAASLADIRRALEHLPTHDRHFLDLVEDRHHDWESVASTTQVLPDSARRRYTRIAERLARWLNKYERDR